MKSLLTSDDVKHMFYALRWPEVRYAENALGEQVRPSALLASGVSLDRAMLESLVQQGDMALQPALKAPAMGDLKASSVAQAFAQSLLRAFGALPHSSWLTFGMVPPMGQLWRGNYIDDIS